MNPRALAVFQPSAGLHYGLDAAAQLAGVPRRTLLLYCRAGLVQPVLQPPFGMLAFTEEAIHTVRHLEQVRARLAADVDGLRALVALRAEVEQLRAELRFWRSR